TFAYDGVRQVLRGVSFDVAPGELIGLVGPSGGGKTTIVNLIARFYDVTGGAIHIDGVDLRRLETGHYRRQMGMVLQDPYLFHGTILENIRYGLPAASLEQVVAAAQGVPPVRDHGRSPGGERHACGADVEGKREVSQAVRAASAAAVSAADPGPMARGNPKRTLGA